MYLKKTFLFIDRPDKADDNAEHLYRYIREAHPKRDAYFVLTKDSNDWIRLKEDGFNLVSYGGLQHFLLLWKCDYYISSHLPKYEIFFLSKKILKLFLDFKVIFLQHGITHNDISHILNKHQIDLIITASNREYNNFVLNKKYKLDENNVKLTGFPRYDQLLKKSLIQDEKSILIMPTWRAEFTKYTKNKIKSNFVDTDYYKQWDNFFISKELELLSPEYKITFIPHPELIPFVNLIKIPEFVIIEYCNDKSIQDVLKSSSILITDYSSIAFDMAILRKKIIYFQFDRLHFFTKSHLYKQDYFDYDLDSFGSIYYCLNDLLNELSLLSMKQVIKDDYINKIDSFFQFGDTNNCKRVMNEIDNVKYLVNTND